MATSREGIGFYGVCRLLPGRLQKLTYEALVRHQQPCLSSGLSCGATFLSAMRAPAYAYPTPDLIPMRSGPPSWPGEGGTPKPRMTSRLRGLAGLAPGASVTLNQILAQVPWLGQSLSSCPKSFGRGERPCLYCRYGVHQGIMCSEGGTLSVLPHCQFPPGQDSDRRLCARAGALD